ncbi:MULTISPECIES: TrbI F-type domain-containing protein [Vibrio]|uniref:TrbI F-type domain-containing protein n=1 Tax=Vibrio TaxID=662 RepID=UPI000CE2D126|nr:MULTISPECIES: TrbI F-type domain-containing protein [Vibrio]MCF6454527.1 TrbI F-type domain-containing protein [Vibrio sp. MMG023]
MINLKSNFIVVVFVMSISMTTSFFTYLFLSYNSPTFVTFNVKGTLDRYHQELIKKGLNVEEQTIKLTEFSEIMLETVDDFHRETNSVVLVDAAVVGGATDVSPQIQTLIVEAWKNKGKP